MAKVTTPNGDTLDVTSRGALAYYMREPGYTVEAEGEAEVEQVTVIEQTLATFDPADATVDEVLAYLDGASDEEHDRVIELERAGKARKGITGDE